MASYNKCAVVVGERLTTKTGESTKWTVDEPSYQHNGKTYAPLVCDCGTKDIIRVAAVLRSRSSSCRKCAGARRKDPVKVGDVIGNYTIQEIIGNAGESNRHTRVRAICHCGQETRRDISGMRAAVARGQHAGCAKCRPFRQRKADPLGRFLKGVWHRKLSGLTREQMLLLARSACFYCGSPPTNKASYFWCTGKTTFVYQGVDEVVYGQGHVIGNILPCCFKCNRAKNKQPLDEFCDWWNIGRIPDLQLTADILRTAATNFGLELSKCIPATAAAAFDESLSRR